MPAVARKNEVDTVDCVDGTPGTPCDGGAKNICDNPSIQATKAGSSDVRVNSIGVVRLGDVMKSHPAPVCGCAPHAPVLTAVSSLVRANGLGIGRIGDLYTSGHVISSGSGDVSDGSPQG